MSKQRTKLQFPAAGEKPSEQTYRPIPNAALVKTIPNEDESTPEYAAILPYVSDDAKIGSRVLRIVNATEIQIAANSEDDFIRAVLNGDAIFIFNALLAKRGQLQSMLEMANFNSGFRGDHYTSIVGNLATPLSRPIGALDHLALEATGDIMIDRTHWGSGNVNKQPTRYRIKEDIVVIDARNPQQ